MSVKDILEMEYQNYLQKKEAEESGKAVEEQMIQVNARITAHLHTKLELAAEKYGSSKARLMVYLLDLALADMCEAWEISEKQVMERLLEKSKGEAA